MNIKGINRVIVAVKDIEQSKTYYTKVLGASFHEANWTGAPYGINVAISWDAGIELCAPMKGREHDSAVSAFLEKNGEGVMNVVIGFDDVALAKIKAEAAGMSTLHSLDYSQDEIDRHLDALFQKYEEHIIDSAQHCGFSITLAQIDAK
jgi:catechol 2,3-dioxygenase-like lactoylglutathione lyase family enzyme